ncbi:hypothetical protein L3X38_030144 [Prunus dulcis]|uniref:Uncharacterized protein n=1 Tax=Prunus dulcis TaxID=3755 RepID=A0AAD4VAS3_PRUDU|nr:hypothetical protein L3X38_030144 [Prunus dulcis]
MPPSGMDHLIGTLHSKSKLKPPKIPILPPRLLLLVPKPPQHITLVRFRPINRGLILQEHNGLKEPQIKPLHRNQSSRVRAIHSLQILTIQLGWGGVGDIGF